MSLLQPPTGRDPTAQAADTPSAACFLFSTVGHRTRKIFHTCPGNHGGYKSIFVKLRRWTYFLSSQTFGFPQAQPLRCKGLRIFADQTAKKALIGKKGIRGRDPRERGVGIADATRLRRPRFAGLLLRRSALPYGCPLFGAARSAESGGKGGFL